MKYAWIENDKIRDVCNGNPDECYHPEIAKFYNAEVPDNAENGDGWVNSQLVKPEPMVVEPVTIEPVAPKISPVEFKLLFTSAERVAIKSARTSDPIIDDFFDIIEDPRLTLVDLGLQSTKDAIDYLESKALITAERKAEILKGVVV